MENKLKCDHQRITAYLLNRMTEEEENAFQTHLMECEACRTRLMTIRKMAAILKEDESGQETVVVKPQNKRILFYLSSIAAGLLILIGISTFWNKQQSEESLYPTSIEYQQRATEGKKTIQLLSPAEGITHLEHQPILFSWDVACDYRLKITHGKTILLDITGNGTTHTVSTDRLAAYTSVDWSLTVAEQTYSGTITFTNNK